MPRTIRKVLDYTESAAEADALYRSEGDLIHTISLQLTEAFEALSSSQG